MKVLFNDGSIIPINLSDSSVIVPTIIKIYKHLQHIPIPFREWDSPFYNQNYSYWEIVDRLTEFGQLAGVKVDKQQCLDNSQEYFNLIHKIYEDNYDGTPAWLDFHEHIHICESFHTQNQTPVVEVDYREKAGMLERPFNFAWAESAVVELKAGDVYTSWAELGKSPYDYWKNNEPDNLQRLCQLAKPWLILRPKLHITLQDVNRLENRDIVDFNNWWKNYQEDWCLHWNIPDWTIKNMFSCSVIGNIDNINNVTQLLKNKIYPEKVIL